MDESKAIDALWEHMSVTRSKLPEYYDAGRLDCGSLDRLARQLAVAAGYTADFEDLP